MCVCVWNKEWVNVVAHHKYWILITVLVDLSKWSRVATLYRFFSLMCFSAGVRPQSGEDAFRSLFVFLSLLTIPAPHNSPLFPSPSFTLSPSLPAVRDNYFQTSGPLGEAVLSKAAFIKNSRSCVDVFALRWRERKRDGKSDKRDTKRKREQQQSYLSWDLFLSWMRLQQ